MQEIGEHGVYEVLKKRTANRLRRSGSAQRAEARERARRAPHAPAGERSGVSERREQGGDLRPTRKSPPSMDEDIENFELAETMRQQRSQLEEWVERTKFSERERQVYELDKRTNFNTIAIARELGIPAKKVRDYRSRYVVKLREAAGL